jgi:hypothetical protein
MSDINSTPTGSTNNGAEAGSSASTTVSNPVSVGNSSQANMRTDAIKALQLARDNAAAREADAQSAQSAKREEGIREVNIDNAPDFGMSETKGLNYNQVYDGLPDDAKKIIANLRSDYTKKTQSIAEQRKILEADRKALLESGFYDNMAKQADVSVELDPFNAGSIEAKIQQEVAKRMREMLEPMRQEAAVNKRAIALDNFKRENPDIDTYRVDIARELMKDKTLTLEKAYWMVKGQKTTEISKQTAHELAQYKKAAQDYGLKVGGANRGSGSNIPDHVKKQGSYAIYEYIKASKG